jgi:hypothetical protein
MKTTVLLVIATATVAVLGCDKKEEGGDKSGAAPASGPKSTGVKECDDYLATLEKCVKNAPSEAKALQEQGLKTARETYGKADVPATVKASWAASCKTANDALSSTPYCK